MSAKQLFMSGSVPVRPACPGVAGVVVRLWLARNLSGECASDSEQASA